MSDYKNKLSKNKILRKFYNKISSNDKQAAKQVCKLLMTIQQKIADNRNILIIVS